jgi:hypothetical protein
VNAGSDLERSAATETVANQDDRPPMCFDFIFNSIIIIPGAGDDAGIGILKVDRLGRLAETIAASAGGASEAVSEHD